MALSLQPLTAAPAAGQSHPETPASRSKAKRDLRQAGEKDKGDKAKSNSDGESKKKWTKDDRRDLVKKAQVWAPTNIPSMDLRLGPQGPEAFQPGQEVACDYVYDEDLPGTSRKFNCAISKNDVVKVRYGEENGKVEGEVHRDPPVVGAGVWCRRCVPGESALSRLFGRPVGRIASRSPANSISRSPRSNASFPATRSRRTRTVGGPGRNSATSTNNWAALRALSWTR